MAEINLGVGIGVSVPNLHMADPFQNSVRCGCSSLGMCVSVFQGSLPGGKKHMLMRVSWGGSFRWKLICVARMPQTDFVSKQTLVKACFRGATCGQRKLICVGWACSNRFLFQNIC